MPRVIITVPERNAQPYRFSLDRTSVSIGRGSDNDIVIDSGSVSGKHAEMRRIEGGYELVDLGSTNGIKNRGVRHDRIALDSGMSLRIGDVSFDFTLSEDELQSLARERPTPLPPLPPEPEPEPVAEEDAPKPKRKASPAPKPEPMSAGAILTMVIVFILLAASALFTGMAIRHQRETGEPLIKAIVNKADRVEKAAK